MRIWPFTSHTRGAFGVSNGENTVVNFGWHTTGLIVVQLAGGAGAAGAGCGIDAVWCGALGALNTKARRSGVDAKLARRALNVRLLSRPTRNAFLSLPVHHIRKQTVLTLAR